MWCSYPANFFFFVWAKKHEIQFSVKKKKRERMIKKKQKSWINDYTKWIIVFASFLFSFILFNNNNKNYIFFSHRISLLICWWYSNKKNQVVLFLFSWITFNLASYYCFFAECLKNGNLNSITIVKFAFYFLT